MGIKIGIDAGSTSTKLVAVCNGGVVFKTKIKSVETDKDIKEVFNSFLSFEKENGYTLDDIDRINLTGLGTSLFADELGGKATFRVSEFDANTRGASFWAQGCDDFLLVSLGTGTSFVRVKDGVPQHIGGISIGGGTVRGLAKYLVGETDTRILNEMAQRGSSSKVDLLIADVATIKVDGLSEDTVVSNFGKADDNVTKDDLVAGIYSLVIFNTLHPAGILAQQLGIDTIVIIGGMANAEPMKVSAELFSAFNKVDYILPTDGTYITALGAALV